MMRPDLVEALRAARFTRRGLVRVIASLLGLVWTRGADRAVARVLDHARRAWPTPVLASDRPVPGFDEVEAALDALVRWGAGGAMSEEEADGYLDVLFALHGAALKWHERRRRDAPREQAITTQGEEAYLGRLDLAESRGGQDLAEDREAFVAQRVVWAALEAAPFVGRPWPEANPDGTVEEERILEGVGRVLASLGRALWCLGERELLAGQRSGDAQVAAHLRALLATPGHAGEFAGRGLPSTEGALSW